MQPIDIRIQYTFFTPALTTLLYGPWLNFSFYFGHTSWCVEFQFADHGSNPHTLQWKCGVLTTGLPGKFLNTWSHISLPFVCYAHYTLTILVLKISNCVSDFRVSCWLRYWQWSFQKVCDVFKDCMICPVEWVCWSLELAETILRVRDTFSNLLLFVVTGLSCRMESYNPLDEDEVCRGARKSRVALLDVPRPWVFYFTATVY